MKSNKAGVRSKNQKPTPLWKIERLQRPDLEKRYPKVTGEVKPFKVSLNSGRFSMIGIDPIGHYRPPIGHICE